MNPVIHRTAGALLASFLIPLALAAQDVERSRFSGTVSLLNTQPVGALATDPGIGLAISAAYALDPLHIFRIRGEIRGALYDWENREVCISATVGCRIVVDLNTHYSTFYLAVGPELVLPIGRTELALDGTLGWAAFTTSSSLSGVDDNDESFGDTTNYEDNTLAWSGGGELRIPVASRLAIALGTHYQHNGRMSYLTEGGITDNPDGSITLHPIETDANFLALTVGVSFRPVLER